MMMEFIHLLNDTEIREDHGEDFGEGYCISRGGSQTCDEDSGGEGAHGKFGHQRQDTMSRYYCLARLLAMSRCFLVSL